MIEVLESAEIERFRGVITQRLGLHFDETKLGFLADVLSRRLQAVRQGADRYLAALRSPAAPRDELRALAGELTVAESYFFRNGDQFRAFADIALPDRMKARPAGGTLRILSAGCAAGEEAYSLAIVLRERPVHLTAGRIEILAVDVNPAVLERARLARYSAWALRETPAEIQERWFRADGREFALDDEARAMVTFDERNLVDEEPFLWRPEVYDVVFCRNVVMYFAPEQAQALVNRIAGSLAPGGYLFLGHAETLRGLSHDFRLCHTHETFYYQRKPADAAVRLEPWAPDPSASTTALLAAPLAAIVDATGSWAEAIGRASARIEHLTQAPALSPPRDLREAGVVGGASELDRATTLLREERFGEALSLVRRLPPESARDPEVLLLRAVLLTQSGDLAGAERTCLELLAIDEFNAGAHYLLATCREAAGDRWGAVEHDRVATYLDPAFAMPRLHLGLLARRTGDKDRARRELAQALVLLRREDPSRVLLFGGGFSRDALVTLCHTELVGCGGGP